MRTMVARPTVDPDSGRFCYALTPGPAAALVRLQVEVQPDPGAADHYRRVRPLVERSATALSGVFAELDAVSS